MKTNKCSEALLLGDIQGKQPISIAAGPAADAPAASAVTLESPELESPSEPMAVALTALAQAVVIADAALPANPRRTAASCSMDAIEEEMRKHPSVEIPPRHHFAKGVYAREILIPAGTLLTGKIHKTEHLNIVSKGEIAVWTETEGVQRVKAPFTFVAKPGTRRLGYAIEDTVWTTIHGTEETDLAKLEETLIETNNKLTGGSPCLG